MSIIFETPPWKKVNVIKQEKLEWKDSFFCFKKSENEVIPTLTDLENDINILKKEIETSFTDSYEWDSWKKLGNPYEFVFTPSKDKYPLPSLSIQNPLSRSYFKLWEMFKIFDINFPRNFCKNL